MKVIKANIVDLWKNGNIVCVTTNGFLTASKKGVMGRGNALAMANTIPELKTQLGKHLVQNGNNVGFIYDRVIAFPVKPDYCFYEEALTNYKLRYIKRSGKGVPGFYCKADINLIKRSLEQLIDLIKKDNLTTVYLPIPGIKNGELPVEDVKRTLVNLPEQIILVHL
jgi:hypothetical protein